MNTLPPNHYNYIIAGAGAAGLSLLMRLLQEPALQQQSVLVIDQQTKNSNDRTWCFWEVGAGLFEPIVHHRWQQLRFAAPHTDIGFSIAPYTYKMIRGIDFYHYVLNHSAAFPRVNFLQATVMDCRNTNTGALVETDKGSFTADYVFNSIVAAKELPPPNFKGYFLWQHFKGKIIETPQPVFNASEATFMDFTVSQHNGTTFMYVLPFSANTALVEYTLFTKQLLPLEAYDAAIQTYMQEKYGVAAFTTLHNEWGKIPMTNYRFAQPNANIIPIGIAGGQAKGSSGYAFYFIQQQTARIVQRLVQHQHPAVSAAWLQRRFQWYDKVLLRVLDKQLMPGAEIFTAIFKKNKPTTILRFLNNESSLVEDGRIMSSVPMHLFLPAALHTALFR
jgi:lycopene beta-cyclase